MGGKDSSYNRFRFGVDLQLKNWQNSLKHLLPKGSLHFGGSESSKMLYVRQDCRGALTFDNSGKKTSSFVKIILVFLCVQLYICSKVFLVTVTLFEVIRMNSPTFQSKCDIAFASLSGGKLS